MADTPRPVLKWAGGKRQLLNVIDAHLPPEVADGEITTYVEPMIGGAAVFFHIKKKTRGFQTSNISNAAQCCLQ